MQKRTKDYIKGLTLGQGEHHRNMSVFPVFFEINGGLKYLTLDEALGNSLVQITEVSETGDVPNLKVTNKQEVPILILAGEELVGAKQNRIVNATFLVAGHSALTIPVSCVEQGRWNYSSREFRSERRMSSPQLRSKVEQDVMHSIRESQEIRANQSRVWDEIAAKSSRMEVRSSTSAMAAIYESYTDQLKRFSDVFTVERDQKGFLVAINGRVIGMEIFDAQASLGKYFDKLIQSYSLDAIDLQRERQSTRDIETKAESWVEVTKDLPLIASSSLGLGKDLRIESGTAIGSGLMHEGKVIYLSVFAKNNAREPRRFSSGMARASRRGSFAR